MKTIVRDAPWGAATSSVRAASRATWAHGWCKQLQRETPLLSVFLLSFFISPSRWVRRIHSAARLLQIMPHDPDPPPAKRFKPGSPFFRLDKKPGMLLPRAGHAPVSVDAQRRQLPIYPSRTQVINQLRQLHNAVFIGKTSYGSVNWQYSQSIAW